MPDARELLPFDAGIHRRALIELAAAPLKARGTVRRPQQRQVGAARRRGGSMRVQIGKLCCGPVAVGASDFDRRLSLVVDVTVAVIVIREVAIDALHAEIGVN